jgi:hypothetical protein
MFKYMSIDDVRQYFNFGFRLTSASNVKSKVCRVIPLPNTEKVLGHQITLGYSCAGAGMYSLKVWALSGSGNELTRNETFD